MSEGYTINIRALINGVHVKIERFSYQREGTAEFVAKDIETVWERLPGWLARWEKVMAEPDYSQMNREFMAPAWTDD